MAITELPALAQRIGYTVSASASVWGDNGPTIILVEEGPTAVYVAMRHGTTASVRHTATGKVFAAFGSRERAAAALAAEGFAGALDEPAFAAELDAVRNSLRAWSMTNGHEVTERPYESWKNGVDQAFTADGKFDVYWAVKH